ncbi:response regulator transcription factor [Tunicatimonas pelagia]|uniref:response regulator transcription factor n=1 Tax=Tunicatimonas pelagia TaxID=931531 RepID=UPI002665D4CA|nr:response regulator transcription factor [Tunicatimonas pelagia]WKN44585.1 response regulator transcription factor [Tunicatimonas pelagia]
MNIIIAEDHLLYRQGVVKYLTSLFPDSHIKEASDGIEMMSIIKHFQPDVAIIDLEMPKMDGIDTISYLRNHNTDTKVLVVTMHDNPEILQEVIALGIQGVLVKGENEECIGDAIKVVMKGKHFFSESSLQLMQDELIQRNRFQRDFFKLRTLTDREIEVLKLICREMTNKEIASTLHLSPRTVDNHRNSLLEKCEVKNTVGLVKFAIRHHLER